MNKFEDYSILQNNLVLAIDQQPETNNNLLKLNWINKAPQGRANQIARVLGPPNLIDIKPGGLVIWNYVDPFFRQANVYQNIKPGFKPIDVYSKLIIKDEQIPHIVPAPHTDWFYAYMYLDIPDDKVDTIRKLSESIGYDTMTKEAYGRCHFMPANLTSLYLIKQISQGHKSLEHAMQEYAALIPKLMEEEKMGHGLLDRENAGPWHRALTIYTFDIK